MPSWRQPGQPESWEGTKCLLPNQQRTLNNLLTEHQNINFCLTSTDGAYKISTKRAKTCTCNVDMFRLSFRFAHHHWLVVG